MIKSDGSQVEGIAPAETERTSLAVLGAGLMGSAVTSSLLKCGYDVAVWNRTSERCGPLVEAGASFEPDLSATLAASAVVILMLSDYAAARSALAGHEHSLRGRAVVNLMTSERPISP